MTFNAMTEHYEEITVCGKPALFTSIRIKRYTIPDGLYAYDVRHDDECRGIQMCIRDRAVPYRPGNGSHRAGDLHPVRRRRTG